MGKGRFLPLHALAAAALCGWAGAAAAIELSPSEAAGRRIFLEGVSPSGATLSARVGAAAVAVPAAVVRCANCHGADGRGRSEGGVRPPDITWRRLSAPAMARAASAREHPPYDEASFMRALTEGIDPAGNRLDPAMPRFVMSMRDLKDLAAYLQRIEDDRDPGLLEDVVRIGTLLPSSGPLRDAGRTAAAVLRGLFAEINDAGGIHGRRLELVVADPGQGRADAEAALRELAGQGEVFALAGLLAPSLDGALGELADALRIPAVGPLGHLSEPEGARFLFEPLGGLREELFALAEFAGALDPGPRGAAVVHPDEPGARTLAAALVERLARRGVSGVHPFAYPPARLDAAAVAELVAARGGQALFFLGRSEDFAALSQEIGARLPDAYLFAASSQVGASALSAPPSLSGRIFLAYPVLPADLTAQGLAVLEAVRRRSGLDARHAPLQLRTLAAGLVLAEGLKRAGRDASRVRLVTALERLYDFRTGLTPPLRFAPGQHVGAAGAHIVTVDAERGDFRPTGRYVRLDRAMRSGE